jgi:hypothetical protein
LDTVNVYDDSVMWQCVQKHCDAYVGSYRIRLDELRELLDWLENH